MPLTGNLDTFFLSSIMQLLYVEKKTGTLEVKNNNNEVQVIVKEGSIVYAMSNNKEARLGNLLRIKGVITLEELEICLEEGNQKKQALGKVLVEKGIISLELLTRFIRKQVEEIVYSLFLWESGEFIYKDALLDLSGIVITELDITRIILEASRRIDEISVLKKYIPNDQIVYGWSGKVQDKEELKLSPNEWRILNLIDGKRTIEQLLEICGLDHLVAYKILYSLISSGLAEKRETASLRPPAKTAGNQNQKEEYGPIITGYNNILHIIWRNLESEIGKETAILFTRCKPEPQPGQRDLFKNYHPNNPLPANIYVLHENLKSVVDLKNEQVFLAENFNRYILNLLNQIPELLGIFPTRKMLDEIEKVLPYISRYIKGIKPGNDITADITRITMKIEQQIGEMGKK